MAWTAPRTWVAGETVTAAYFNTHLRDNLLFIDARVLGYASSTAVQGSITAETDLTGLTTTVTVGSTRRVKVTGKGLVQNTTAGARTIMRIHADGVQVDTAEAVVHAVSTDQSLVAMAILTPSAGSHTYKLRGVADTGTMTFSGSAAAHAFILVEDIGSA